MVEMTIFLS